MTVDNLTVITNNVNPDKAGFFESILGGVNLATLHISRN